MTGRAPRCWGIGLSRTGTTTFCAALVLLGYRNVRHNPLFEELAGLDGGADSGVLLFYKYLDYKFPGSKFVLTLRSRESWLRSAEYIFGNYPLASRAADVAIMRRMTIYETVAFDRAKFISAYERHVADVRRYFHDRPNDLLEMDIAGGDGWEKLCPFLGLPVPAVPFPHHHARPESAEAQAG
jgi:hypothetical protein